MGKNQDKTFSLSKDFGDHISNWKQDRKDLNKRGWFSDASFVSSDGQQFPVHKFVLATCGDYFKALFAPGYSQNSVITFDDITGNVLEILIDFCYSGTLEKLSSTNIEQVMRALDRFNMTSALELCHQFLISNVSVNNCLQIFRLGIKYSSVKVQDVSRRVILYEIRELSETTIGQMTYEELNEFLSDDRLNVSREEQTYEIIRKWVEIDTETRLMVFPDLMKNVRFGNAAIKFIENELLAKNKWIESFPLLLKYLIDANEILRDIQAEPIPSKFDVVKYPFLRPRIPRDIVFTFGGWSGASATSTIETYDCRVNKWYSFGQVDTQSRAYHGMVNFDGLIYIIGGFDGTRHFSSVVAFDPAAKTWSERSNMQRARCYVSTAVLNDMIYACGGFDGITRTDTCERYDPKANQWSTIPSMNHSRSDASCATLNGRIYVVGGFDGTEVLASCEFFDPKTGIWTLVETMNTPRSGVQAVAYENMIYVFGGNDGLMRQTTGEKYDPEKRSWSALPEMKIPRSNFAAVPLEGLIYIVGGFNGQTTINEVECYDPRKNSWHDMWSMGLHRSALSACVVSRLPNGKEYTWLRRELQNKTPAKSFKSRRRINPLNPVM